MDYIYKVLTQPGAKPPELPSAPTGKPAPRPRRHYQELPHARPGGIAGLLELLLDHNGKDDIYRLADDLGFEIDDLLPIVDAAQLLGFLTVIEGDAEITPAGADYANSEILRQKQLFRKAALDNVLLLRQIVRAIEAKSNHSVPEEFFHDLLDEQFTEEVTCASWRPPSAGDATPSCSTSTPRAGGSSSRSCTPSRSTPPAPRSKTIPTRRSTSESAARPLQLRTRPRDPGQLASASSAPGRS